MKRREFLRLAAVGGGAAAVSSVWLLAENRAAVETAPEASPIVFNQLGYLPDAAKMFTLRAPSATFTVRAVNGGAIALQDKAGAVHDDAASGDRVELADLSSLRKPGTYAIETDAGKSAPFEIGNEVYRRALWLTMRSYYGQRCGCNVDLGDGYSHPACHLAAEFHKSSGKSGTYKNHGGWHDAGDYGRYLVNSGISTGTLLWAWEMCNGAVRKLDLKIPESGGKI